MFSIAFGSLSLPLIWDKLHKFFLNIPLHVPLTLTTGNAYNKKSFQIRN